MTVLVIAPHPDDEILGCGGVIAKRAEAGDDVWVCIMSEGKRPMYSKEFIKEEFREMQIAHSNVGVGHFIRVALPTARLDTIPQYKLNGILTDIVDTVQPDEVFIPHRGDMHRDPSDCCRCSNGSLETEQKSQGKESPCIRSSV